MPSFDPDALQRQLERDLDTIRKYKDLVARHGGKEPQQQLPLRTPPGSKPSLAAIVERNLTDEWQGVGLFHEKVKAGGWPKSARAAVATSLRRLVEKGKAEKRGDKTEGIEFRRKQSA